MPRLSLIIPVFNRQALAERAIASVLAQALDGLEIIVVDDCSLPPFQLPQSLCGNICVIRHQENKGAAAARNTGIKNANAPWLAFLDSDDYWLPNTLRARLDWAEQNFARNGNSMVAYAAAFTLIPPGGGQHDTRIPRASRDVSTFASGCWFSPGSTLILRKEAFETVGPLDPNLKRLEDFDWFLRFGLAGGSLEVWPQVVAMIELGPKPSRATLQETARRLHAKYINEGALNPLPPALRRRVLAYLDIELASASLAQRDFAATAFYLARSFLRVPRLTLPLERFWARPAKPNA